MRDQSPDFSNLPIANANAQVTIQNNPHQGIRAADFVGRTQGKLRDFYRIGKVLGTGKYQPFFG